MALPLQFRDDGLVPVVVQDRLTGEIRMVAYASSEALSLTLRTGRATFWSRSRSELWEKGKTSGNAVLVDRVLVDCDADAVVYQGEPEGPTCHTGATSCFFRTLESGPGEEGEIQTRGEPPQTLLGTLEAMLESRKKSTGAVSYTRSLYDGGAPAIGAKMREEADELARAIASESDERVVSEAADTLYHLLVGLRWRSIPFRRVLAELSRRLGTGGHVEKAERKHRSSPQGGEQA
jgi:phosphoribosyl-ATP pyrophosphohydrolase/phosphoribosyl-AMP cyclohydrolase